MVHTTRRVIVIRRNGETILVTGWRAWLLGVGGMLVAWFVLALILFVLVGVAITLGLTLLLLLPAVAVVILVGSLMRRRLEGKGQR